jgi:4-amino-4-deoxy-L-arabinose transferase-like glycosyltransferase
VSHFSSHRHKHRPGLRWQRFLLLPLILITLAPRLAAIGRYVTPDELIWVLRSIRLRQALLSGTWAETIQSGHPGITTTWIGAIAVQIQLWLRPHLAADVTWLEQLHWLSTENSEAFRRLYQFLEGARIGVIVVTLLGLLLFYVLAQKPLGRTVALAATALLALDPFFAGLSGLLHVDALLTTFILLALVLAIRAAHSVRPGRYLLGAGIATALALLTKTPGLILLALMPAILLWPVAKSHLWHEVGQAHRPSLRQTAGALALWATAFLATTLLLLPALWADPAYVLQHTTGLTGRFAGETVRSTFFMGRTVDDPGALFYPATLLFRLSPLATVGLLVAFVGLVRAAKNRERRQVPALLLWLLLFSAGFLVAISLVTLKYDRYALPALAVLTVVAGWGLVWLAGRVRWLLPLLFGLQLLYLLLALPYPLLAYNWLAGGGRTAAQVMPVGWGESASTAARWLAEETPDAQQRTLYTGNLPATAPFFPGDVVRLKPAFLSRLQAEDYVLVVGDQEGGIGQMPSDSRPLQQFELQAGERAQLYGGLQAADFGLPTLQLQTRDYQFEQEIALASAGAVLLPWPAESAVVLEWLRLAEGQPSDSYQLQLALVDGKGHTRATQEVPLLNQSDHAPRYWPVGQRQPVAYAFPVPAHLPPGDYQVQARLFNAAGEQLGVFSANGSFAGTQAVVDSGELPPPDSQPEPEVPVAVDEVPYLAGRGELPAQAETGHTVTLDLWWRSGGPEPSQLVLSMAGIEASAAINAESWQAGQVYQLLAEWRLPLEIPQGQHTAYLQARDEQGRPLWSEPLPLEAIEIMSRDREFQLPAQIDPLGIQVSDVAWLQSVDVSFRDNETVVDVVWQANQGATENYITFVHLRDEQGEIVDQVDRPPQPLTASWAPGEVVVEQYVLQRPSAGAYTIALGLYNDSGLRLPLYNAEGMALPDDEYRLEVQAP